MAMSPVEAVSVLLVAMLLSECLWRDGHGDGHGDVAAAFKVPASNRGQKTRGVVCWWKNR